MVTILEKNLPFASPDLRLPPQDLSAEKAFLGSIMIKPESMTEVADLVKVNDFYSEKHRKIFQSIC